MLIYTDISNTCSHTLGLFLANIFMLSYIKCHLYVSKCSPVWDGKENQARKYHLVVRREINSPQKKKYSLSNASSNTPTKRLAFMQAQRYWVERPFQDAKNQCGMGEYQARGWFAWHHHMSMVMMAMLFILEQRLHHQGDIPLLSCCDITTLLKSVLPRRDISETEILRQLGVRHRKRQDSIDAAYEKQKEIVMME